MDKSNKILIGAFLILLIGFLISSNGNMITGKFSKDVTGSLTIEEIAGSGTTVESDCGGDCPQECIDHGVTCNLEVKFECYSVAQSHLNACLRAGGSQTGCMTASDKFSKKNVCTYYETEPTPPTGECNFNTKTECSAQNTISLSAFACEGKSEAECTGDCKWYAEAGLIGLSPCRPATKCVWLYDENAVNKGHCCGDLEKWSPIEGCISIEETAGEQLCFSFWPSKQVPGESIKETSKPYKHVCVDIGSMSYGFWTPVEIIYE